MKENLKVDSDYHIIDFKIWNYLASHYGGSPIVRFSYPVYFDERDIEVNLIKLKVYDLPKEK